VNLSLLRGGLELILGVVGGVPQLVSDDSGEEYDQARSQCAIYAPSYDGKCLRFIPVMGRDRERFVLTPSSLASLPSSPHGRIR
jgi:hypothetical protein